MQDMAKNTTHDTSVSETSHLHATLVRTRWQIAFAATIVVVFAGALVWYFAGSGSVISIDEKKLLAGAKERAAKHSDEIIKEATDLGSEVIPPLYDEIAEQAQDDYPKYLRLTKQQAQVLKMELEDALRKKLRKQFRQFLTINKQVLAEQFPKYATEKGIERLIRKFEMAYDRILQRYYVPRFRKAMERTEELWTAFPPLENVSPSTDLDQMFVEAFEAWIVANIAEVIPEEKTKAKDD